MAYLEGWTALNDSKHLPEVYAFMNFHLDPKNYADFVNTTGTAYLEPAATKLIDKKITNDPILAFDPDDRLAADVRKDEGPGDGALDNGMGRGPRRLMPQRVKRD